MTLASTETTDDLKRFHRPWYWYDWANSAFVTTVGTVLFGPYISSIAREAACPGAAEGTSCTTPLFVIPAAEGLPSIIWQIAGVLVVVLIAALIGSLIGYARDRELPWRPSSVLPALAVAALVLVLTAPIAPGAVAPYTTTFATLLSAVLLFSTPTRGATGIRCSPGTSCVPWKRWTSGRWAATSSNRCALRW